MHTPRPVPNRIRALGLVACLALSAVACGDDDDESIAAHTTTGMKTTFTVS